MIQNHWDIYLISEKSRYLTEFRVIDNEGHFPLGDNFFPVGTVRHGEMEASFLLGQHLQPPGFFLHKLWRNSGYKALI